MRATRACATSRSEERLRDTIVRADGQAVTGGDDPIRLFNSERIGRDIAVDVLRRSTLRSVEVRPQERPAAKAA